MDEQRIESVEPLTTTLERTVMDCLRPSVDDRWSDASVVAGFASGAPNPALMQLASREIARRRRLRVLDIGCGAGRNAIPLAMLGADVVGIDRSRDMLDAARSRLVASPSSGRVMWMLAAMDALPVMAGQFDLIVAHGVWNLARSSTEFGRSVADAARAARSGAALFVVTFSRHTLPAHAVPVAGEALVFTAFSGQPQCFLTETQLREELAVAGFAQEQGSRIREVNRPQLPALATGGPVLFEGVFRKTG